MTNQSTNRSVSPLRGFGGFFIVLTALIALFACNKPEAQYSPFICIDQFGYLPESQKIAVLRSPEIGFDSTENYVPAKKYSLVDAKTGKTVFSAAPEQWKGGATDPSSGDKAWHFDFSSVTQKGTYYVFDPEKNVKSYEFKISENVYKNVLKQAFKVFYYQRAGFAKDAKYATEAWADGASHLGELQDANCRKWGHAADAGTERDVQGGWYDAGDFNKYTNWTADYINYLLLAYEENPAAWTDDFGIPESGNGIPDIIDEVLFGVQHLLRLQFDDGSVISVVKLDEAAPPSAAKGQSLWGNPSTSATLSAATSYAYAAKVLKQFSDNKEYVALAEKLTKAAEKAWNWAEKNPDVKFYNNSWEHGTQGLAAGQQEVDDQLRLEKKLHAAMRLFALTGDKKYQTFFDKNYKQTRMIAWSWVAVFGEANQDMLLNYAQLKNATPEVAAHIKQVYRSALDTAHNLPAVQNFVDPYFAYQKDYVWGSNGTNAKQGAIYYNIALYNIDSKLATDAKRYAEYYVHYLHGVNPLNMCYLTNMSKYGAEHSANTVFHAWFHYGNETWGGVGKSTYGPAPGILVGGPNPAYDWDKCCPKNCDSDFNNSQCFAHDISRLRNQPAQKSYLDMNMGWPLNLWSVSENSNGYQVHYLRLLSKFVK
ncbi:MAG: glycoside hydrolase family 9 protein [Bacteroidetes bacterium]|nr:glycoside hydrolase family 9 protein [Bacteroidota bacterium]